MRITNPNETWWYKTTEMRGQLIGSVKYTQKRPNSSCTQYQYLEMKKFWYFIDIFISINPVSLLSETKVGNQFSILFGGSGNGRCRIELLSGHRKKKLTKMTKMILLFSSHRLGIHESVTIQKYILSINFSSFAFWTNERKHSVPVAFIFYL